MSRHGQPGGLGARDQESSLRTTVADDSELYEALGRGGDRILARPQARIIVLTTYEGDVLARRALKAGAAGYILKDMIRTELLDAIRAVHVGRRFIPQKIAAELTEHYTEDDLTERELEILREVARGTSNKIIATHLSISEATVKAHMQKIMLRLGASDRTHAVSIAMTRGFLM